MLEASGVHHRSICLLADCELANASVRDNVLYHAQSWAASPQKVWVRYGDQSLVWIAATKCSQ
jgi:hypothetical protein